MASSNYSLEIKPKDQLKMLELLNSIRSVKKNFSYRVENNKIIITAKNKRVLYLLMEILRNEMVSGFGK